jgi:hypothetical protein
MCTVTNAFLQAKRWEASSGQFLAGQQLTHVDLALFTTLSTLRSGFMPGEGTQLLFVLHSHLITSSKGCSRGSEYRYRYDAHYPWSAVLHRKQPLVLT